MQSPTAAKLVSETPLSSFLRTISRFLESPFSLLLALGLAFFLNSHALPLTDVDEGAFSEATREMMARGNLVSPTLNDQPRHDKPVLIYWAQAASVAAFGQSEIAYRLPSLLASLFWCLALYRFCLRHGDRQTAQVAGLVMVLSLMVGIIAKAAIADALLNLFLALALFWIYDFYCASRAGRQGPEINRLLLAIYAALGLGFLTKGPVALMFPLLISALFFLSAGAWRAWLRAVFHWPGWLLFVAIVLPWHVMVYLDQGDAFFRGFYLQHNLNRYASTFEGHGGNLFYYFLVLPLVMLPFSGWLLSIIGPRLRLLWQARGQSASPSALLERFLLIWFGTVFLFFSFSSTQLPHYLLYGSTPLFILLARHRLIAERRWPAFLPVIIFALLLAALPSLLELAAGRARPGLELMLLEGLLEAFGDQARWLLPAFAVAVIGLALWRRLPVWQGLIIAGLLQASVMFAVVLPRVLAVTQEPVREAALVALQHGGKVVAWRLNQPSFSLYRQAATPSRLPQAGELVLTRSDRMLALRQELAPLTVSEIHRRGFVTLAQVEPRELP